MDTNPAIANLKNSKYQMMKLYLFIQLLIGITVLVFDYLVLRVDPASWFGKKPQEIMIHIGVQILSSSVLIISSGLLFSMLAQYKDFRGFKYRHFINISEYFKVDFQNKNSEYKENKAIILGIRSSKGIIYLVFHILILLSTAALLTTSIMVWVKFSFLNNCNDVSESKCQSFLQEIYNENLYQEFSSLQSIYCKTSQCKCRAGGQNYLIQKLQSRDDLFGFFKGEQCITNGMDQNKIINLPSTYQVMTQIEEKFSCTGLCTNQDFHYYFRDIREQIQPSSNCFKNICSETRIYYYFTTFPAFVGGVISLILFILSSYDYLKSLADDTDKVVPYQSCFVQIKVFNVFINIFSFLLILCGIAIILVDPAIWKGLRPDYSTAQFIIYLISGFIILIFSGYVSFNLFQNENYLSFVYDIDQKKKEWRKQFTVMLLLIVFFGLICLITTIYGGYYFDYMRNCADFSGIKCETMTSDYFNDQFLKDILEVENCQTADCQNLSSTSKVNNYDVMTSLERNYKCAGLCIPSSNYFFFKNSQGSPSGSSCMKKVCELSNNYYWIGVVTCSIICSLLIIILILLSIQIEKLSTAPYEVQSEQIFELSSTFQKNNQNNDNPNNLSNNLNTPLKNQNITPNQLNNEYKTSQYKQPLELDVLDYEFRISQIQAANMNQSKVNFLSEKKKY